jgi:hypothetical protein
MVAVAESVLGKPTVVINDLPNLCPLTAKRKDSCKCCIYSLSILSYEIRLAYRKLYIISWVCCLVAQTECRSSVLLNRKFGWCMLLICVCWLLGYEAPWVGVGIAPLPLRENIYKRK